MRILWFLSSRLHSYQSHFIYFISLNLLATLRLFSCKGFWRFYTWRHQNYLTITVRKDETWVIVSSTVPLQTFPAAVFSIRGTLSLFMLDVFAEWSHPKYVTVCFHQQRNLKPPRNASSPFIVFTFLCQHFGCFWFHKWKMFVLVFFLTFLPLNNIINNVWNMSPVYVEELCEWG